MHTFEFVTDTATMCVFDLACLKHRLEDDADWWSVSSAEIQEVNNGNVAFLNFKSDGKYFVSIVDTIDEPDVSVNLKLNSGRVFFGAAEEVSSDGLEPEALRGGIFLEFPVGLYALHIKKTGFSILVAIKISDISTNSFFSVVRI
ncbi:DUF6386 family protein [Undibacterium pigrum]|uniref:Uncharacterized protein n=1 Tax=Undibacterium pigrum TaxID=401470 RepID=A0A318JD22_9BURK|nr:DUF6386 family protein [Undibacterium pigrum]PXX44840.1 hypothetical protein DFR42_10252 [Undibacterium pigrum]